MSDVYFKRDDRAVYSPVEYANGAVVTRVTKPYMDLLSYAEGTKLPNYKQLIASGQDATTPFIAERQTVDRIGLFNQSIARWEYNGTSQWTRGFGFSPAFYIDGAAGTGSMPNFGTLVSEATAGALKFYNQKLQKIYNPLSTQVFTGEIRDVFRFIVNPLEELVNVYLAFYGPKGSFDKLPKGVARSAALANLFLQFQFAIKPLLGDIESAFKILDKDREFVDKIKAYGEAGSNKSTTEFRAEMNLGHRHQVVTQKTAQCIIRAGLHFELLNEWKGLHDYIQEDFHEKIFLPGALWEITPYSWLVDYIVNIGDVLASLGTAQHELRYSVKTTIKTATETRSWLAQASSSGKNFVLTGPKPVQTLTWRSVKREVLTSNIPPVTFTFDLSVGQVANVIALLIQKLQFLKPST